MGTGRRRLLATGLAAGGALSVLAGVALAHGSGGLRGAAPERLAVPTWLFLLTGGSAVGASFLLSSFVTGRAFLDAVHGWQSGLPAPGAAAGRLARAAGLAVLGGVVVVGLAGPAEPVRNAAVLLVWVGWWAGLAAATYLVGNAWPALDPWRTLAGLLPGAGSSRDGRPSTPSGRLSLPDRAGSWPAVAALLALVWVETVSPLAGSPRLLAWAVLGYTAVTLVGAGLVGPAWFRRVDPVAGVFRTYGRVAPVGRTRDGPALRAPGSGLTGTVLDGPGEVAFVVALLWGTTFDGLVSTPAWAGLAGAAVGAGLPPALCYLLALLAGFGAFLAVFRLASAAARRTAPTFLATDELARRFAPALVPIAAGYHLAHYLGYFLGLAPALGAAVAAPLSPPATMPTLGLPGWFGGVAPAAVLAGHLLAVWVAHGIAYRSFPGRLQATRSQVPLTAAMVAYTTVSLWIVSRPTVRPPFV